jgi:hypothetical protein
LPLGDHADERSSAAGLWQAAPVAGTDELWGGSLVSIRFDPVTWALEIGVEVVTDGNLARYRLVLDAVTEWHLSRGVPLPWDYAELTEIEVTDLEGEVFVEMVLWDDETSLMARCSRMRVDLLP